MKKYLLEQLIMFTKISMYGMLLNAFMLCTLLAGTSSAQEVKSVKEVEFKLQLNGKRINDVIRKIESSTAFNFVYTIHDYNVNKSVVIKTSMTSATVEEALIEISRNSDLRFKQVNNSIFIGKKAGDGKESEPIEVVLQGTTVTGQVSSSENGELLPGVNVIIKGTSSGTVTDLDGNYQIEVPGPETILVFSSIGFVSEELAVGNRSAINVSLTPDIQSLEEIVVIGYGTTTKRELTGSVTSVKAKDFNKGAVTDAMQLIQGKVAGLTITRTNGGDPTEDFEIRLRGTTSITESGQGPLIVVDGIPGGSLSSIAPEDIETIDVLKDGSAAAIYGTRGTNGVILVTTKKGERGATKVSYSTRISTESLLRPVELLNANEYRALKQELMSSPAVPDSSLINKGMEMTDYGFDTDWYDEITRTPVSQIHELSLSGGSDNTTYRVSLFYNNQQGILLNSDREEYRANLNLSQSALNNRLHITLQMGLSNYEQNPVDYNALRQVMQRNPTEPVYNEDGSLNEFIGAWQYDNPVGLLKERINDNNGGNNFGNLGLNLDITESLSATALVGLQTNRALNGYYQPSYSLPQEAAGTTGFASREASKNTSNVFESTLAWNKSLSKHSVNAIVGYSYQKFSNEGFDANNTNFITDGFGYNNLGSGTYLTDGRAGMGSYKNQSHLIAFFGRIIYNFDNKYFLSASLRREGSSKFGANNKWGNFPAISAGWDMTQADFLSGIFDSFDIFKLRAGYGITGNQGIDPYLSRQRFGPSGYYFYNGEFVPGYAPVSNPNPNLKWETKKEINVGVDWALSSNRLGGSLDAYTRETRDLLFTYNVPTPPNLYPQTLANGASFRSSGIELTLNVIPFQSENFQWNVDFNADYRKNKVTSLSSGSYVSLEYLNQGDVGAPGLVGSWTHQLRADAPLGIIHGYVYEGISDEGKWILRDYDPITGESDGEITVDDRADIGNGIPDFYLGFTNTFQYKSWDLTVMARGMFGHQIINSNRIWSENMKFLPRNVRKSALDSELWDDPNFSSYYVENGDFLKIDNITFGYNFPLKDASLVQNLRLYFTGNNLFVITGYSGVDPEVAIGGLTPGVDDRFDYPSTRIYTLGLNITF